jgi:DNA-binding NarL/FixJ family response regulator
MGRTALASGRGTSLGSFYGTRRGELEPVRTIVIEQWSILRSGIRAVLTQGGHAVIGTAETAAEGLGLLADGAQVDLVLLGTCDQPVETVVPEVLEGHRGVKVLVLISDPTRSAANAMLSAGVSGLLDQTAQAPELLAALERIGRGERVLSNRAIDALVGERRQGLHDRRSGNPRPVAPLDDLDLTARELEILVCLGTGASNRDIAGRLFIGEATVKTHLASIYAKLGVVNRHQAVVRASRFGLLEAAAG